MPIEQPVQQHYLKMLRSVLLWLLYISTATSSPWRIEQSISQTSIFLNDVEVIRHSGSDPAVDIGKGDLTFNEHHGNFDIQDSMDFKIPLDDLKIEVTSPDHKQLKFSTQAARQPSVYVLLNDGPVSDGLLEITFQNLPPGYRIWIKFLANPGDKVYGGGEQYSSLNLRGKSYPIFTREQGVGRNKSSLVTFYANTLGGGAGGDYYTSYYSEPTFMSTAGYLIHVSTYYYSVLDFTHDYYHTVQVYGNISRILMSAGKDETIASLSQTYSKHTGLIPELPEWCYNGAILGIQGGTQKMLDYLKEADDHEVSVSALWIQDWSGSIKTSFGKRIFWNWEWNEKQYPNLDKEIALLKQRGVRILTYLNPNLNKDGELYKEADKKGYFVKDRSGKTKDQDFGEFYCGSIDLTNPDARTWFKERIIKKAIDLGISGWMADFSEYLPVDDVVLFDGRSAHEAHNQWPVLWASLNREAVEENGKLGEVMFFSRAGYSGVSNYTMLFWNGDQTADFTKSDGLPSTIPATLSMGLQGVGICHFDIGCYTSLYGIKRTKELLLRSAEHAVFTPIMRTHEGNRPSESWQIYSDENTWLQFSRLVKIYMKLTNYTKSYVTHYVTSGVPVQRALFLYDTGDEECYKYEYQYMYGDELLIAPVIEENVNKWSVYLPKGDWVHLWSDKQYTGKQVITVDAPLGEPPVFYLKTSTYPWKDLKIPLVDEQIKSEL